MSIETPTGAISNRNLASRSLLVLFSLILMTPALPSRALSVTIEAENDESGSVYEDGYCYNGSMEVSNDGVAGHDEAAGWTRFDTSSIPDGSDVTSVVLYFYPYLWDEIAGPHVDFNGFSSDPVDLSCSQRFEDATNGPTFHANGWVIATGWRSVDLGSAGAAALEGLLGEDWFGVGLDHRSALNHWLVAEGFDTSHEPYIEITYQAATPPDPDLRSLTAPLEVPLGVPFEVTIVAENDGGTSAEGAINASVLFSDGGGNLTVSNVSAPWADQSIVQLEPGEGPLYDADCDPIPGGAVHHVVEAVDTSWEQDDEFTLQLDVTPHEAGTLWVRARTTMKGAGSCEYYNDHSVSSGVSDVDQQAWSVERLAIHVNAPPTLSLQQPGAATTVFAGETLLIQWSDDDVDDNAALSLAYDIDDDPTNGGQTWIVVGLPEDPDGASDEHAWDTTDLAAGTYYVWGVIYDGVNGEVYDVAAGQVTIEDAPPVDIRVEPTSLAFARFDSGPPAPLTASKSPTSKSPAPESPAPRSPVSFSIDPGLRAAEHERLRQLLATEGIARVLVLLRDPDSATVPFDIDRARISELRERVLDRLDRSHFTITRRYKTLPGFAGQTTLAGLAELLSFAEVALVEESRATHLALSESVPLIGADQVHAQLGYSGSGVTVAVIDSGIDPDHPDLVDDLIAEHCFTQSACPPLNTDESDSAEDDHGHGTAVAGIISGSGAEAPEGVAPDAEIVAVKVTAGGVGEVADWVAAIDWIVDNHATLGVDVINLSLGSNIHFTGPCDSSFAMAALAVDRARAENITVIAASGNEGLKTRLAAPACLSGVVAVGAVYDADIGIYAVCLDGLPCTETCTDLETAADLVTCYSNSNEHLDLVAPSNRSRTAGLDGGIDEDFGGTSAASPHAAAVAALIVEANPGIGPDEVAAALRTSDTMVPDDGNQLSFPRLDAQRAVTASDLTIFNDGGADLMVTAVDAIDASCWLTLTPAAALPASIAHGASLVVSVEIDVSCVGLGSHADTIRIQSNDPDENIVDVAVSLEVIERPRPDLVLSAPLPSSAPPFLVGQTVSWQTTTTNDGTDNAVPTHTAFYLGTACDDFNEIDSDPVPALAPDESEEVSDAYAFQAADFGQRYLIVRADHLNEEDDELDETNNTACYGPFAVESCFELSLDQTGLGATPVANPASSAGCPAGSYLPGEVITLTALPDPEWQVVGWHGTDDDVVTATTNTVAMPGTDHVAGVDYAELAMVSPNVLVNPGCEVVGAPWYCHSGCELDRVDSPVHSGAGSCFVSEVTETWQGPSQLIDPTLLLNDALYDASAWVQSTVPGAAGQLMLYLSDSTGGNRFLPLSTFQAVSDSDFSPISGSAVVAWQGTLLEARFYVQGSAGEAFYLDDAVLLTGSELHTLSISRTGDGFGSVTSDLAGIDCGVECSAHYSFGTIVELAPAADPGSQFAGWSGACSGTGACLVSVSENRSVTAVFIQDFSTPNLLLNPGCEAGVTPWYCHTGCSLESVGFPVHTGASACRAFGVTQPWQGPAQLVDTSTLIPGEHLCATAWIQGEASFDAQLIAYQRDSTFSDQFLIFSPYEPVSDQTFSSISGSATLDWSGTLEELRFYVQGSAAPFVVDDLVLAPCSEANGDQFSWPTVDALAVPPPGVLANDGEPTGMTASLIRAPEFGTLDLAADGSFVYTPGDGFPGTDTFLYQGHDGTAASNPANVRVVLGLVFEDGFESADLSGWSGAVQE